MADIKSEFEKHALIKKLMATINIAGCDMSYAAFSDTSERMAHMLTQINKIHLVKSSELANLEEKKQGLIHQAYECGNHIHRQLKRIVELSRMSLLSGKTKIKTVDIGVPDQINESEAKGRLTLHIESIIGELRREAMHPGFTEKVIRDKIESRMNSRELLRQVIGGQTIPVSLLKVDQMEKSTMLRTWEDVITNNSGGELFVSCFFLFVALLEYSRSCKTSERGSTGVMITDNPFAATTSPHLLDALMKAAGRFNLQMLCLSAINESSITSKFDLIYQLSLRPTISKDKALLMKDEDGFKANVELDINSRLEHTYVNFEQTTLL